MTESQLRKLGFIFTEKNGVILVYQHQYFMTFGGYDSNYDEYDEYPDLKTAVESVSKDFIMDNSHERLRNFISYTTGNIDINNIPSTMYLLCLFQQELLYS